MTPNRSASGPRRLHKEVLVPATPEAVWRAWTTKEELERWMAAEARVELRPGGPFEILFDRTSPEGQRGSEGCTVLSYLPEEMLSFTWNFPPSLPELREKSAHTFVVIRLRPEGSSSSRVTRDQLGWGEGPAWDRGSAYFDRAWGQVLETLEEHFVPPGARQASP